MAGDISKEISDGFWAGLTIGTLVTLLFTSLIVKLMGDYTKNVCAEKYDVYECTMVAEPVYKDTNNK